MPPRDIHRRRRAQDYSKLPGGRLQHQVLQHAVERDDGARFGRALVI